MGDTTLSANLDSVRQDMAVLAAAEQETIHSMIAIVSVDNIEIVLPGIELPL